MSAHNDHSQDHSHDHSGHDHHHDHDHDHAQPHAPIESAYDPQRYEDVLETAIRELLIEKGVLTAGSFLMMIVLKYSLIQ